MAVSGVRETEAALARLKQRVRGATPDVIDKVLEQGKRHAQVLLSAGQHVRGTPTGSTPGSPPWRIGGHLRDAWRLDRAKPLGADRWSGQVGPTARYSRIQELGGVTGRGHHTRLPPRPYFKPAWAIVRPSVGRTFARAWADATREALG